MQAQETRTSASTLPVPLSPWMTTMHPCWGTPLPTTVVWTGVPIRSGCSSCGLFIGNVLHQKKKFYKKLDFFIPKLVEMMICSFLMHKDRNTPFTRIISQASALPTVPLLPMKEHLCATTKNNHIQRTEQCLDGELCCILYSVYILFFSFSAQMSNLGCT